MKRVNNEITDMDELLRILKECQVMRLAINDDGYPYIVPVNYGFRYKNGRLYLYLHGADAGTKKTLIAKDCRIGFEMDINNPAVINEELSCNSYMTYESICGKGNASIVEESSKEDSLTVIMQHYSDKPVHFSEEMINKTMVIMIEVTHITGKFLQK